MAVVDIADRLPISRPAVSRHLRVLSDAGLVAEERAGHAPHLLAAAGGGRGGARLPRAGLGRCGAALHALRREHCRREHRRTAGPGRMSGVSTDRDVVDRTPASSASSSRARPTTRSASGPSASTPGGRPITPHPVRPTPRSCSSPESVAGCSSAPRREPSTSGARSPAGTRRNGSPISGTSSATGPTPPMWRSRSRRLQQTRDPRRHPAHLVGAPRRRRPELARPQLRRLEHPPAALSSINSLKGHDHG